MKINSVFISPDDKSGPRQFCDICKQYYKWVKDMYVCPACGDKGDPIESSKKVLKADTNQPMIASKKNKKKEDDDLPKGAYWIDDNVV